MSSPPGPDHQPPAGTAPQVLARTAARTVFLRQGADGQPEVVKRYDRGTLDDARREFHSGSLADIDGIVRLRELSTCPQTGRPQISMSAAAGIDLTTRLRRNGLPSPLETLRWCGRLAEILAALHAAHLVHGDVKPSNVMVAAAELQERAEITLIDLEHLAVVGETHHGSAARFTGGTHGYAPPEAYDGVPANPSFDVFGLGCVLFEALTGCRAARLVAGSEHPPSLDLLPLDPVPADLAEFVRRCLSASNERPSAAQVATFCKEIATAADFEANSRLTVAWQRGESQVLDALEGHLAAPAKSRMRRRSSRLDRLSEPREIPRAGTPTDPLARALELRERFHRLGTRLRWFPRHAGLRSQWSAAVSDFDSALRDAPSDVAHAMQSGSNDDARNLLTSIETVLRRVGPPPLSASGQDQPAHLTDRDPLTLLSATRRDLEREQREIDAWRGRFATAVTAIDPAAAEATADACATEHGGARRWVAELRDRSQRFSFYLERVSHRARLVEELAALADSLDSGQSLATLRQLAQQLREVIEPLDPDDDPGAEARTRPLLGALRDLLRDFPEVEATVRPALGELESFCESVTDRGWELAAAAEAMLARPPIPIRLLETELGRLDALLLSDVIVDRRPSRPRLALVDAVESLRARIEEARAARDRITRGAQQAMDRGHLTTAIFDMERAVDRYDVSATDDPSKTGSDLARQFEEAKRRKREVQEALRRNHQQAARAAALLADPGAKPSDRLAALQEHEELLVFLIRALPADRRAAFELDLHEVHAAQLRETDAAARLRFESESDPRRRAQLARETLETLQQLALPTDGFAPDGIMTADSVSDPLTDSQQPGAPDLERSPQRPRARQTQLTELLAEWSERATSSLPPGSGVGKVERRRRHVADDRSPPADRTGRRASQQSPPGEKAARRPRRSLGKRLRGLLRGGRTARVDSAELEATLADAEPIDRLENGLRFDAEAALQKLRAFLDLQRHDDVIDSTIVTAAEQLLEVAQLGGGREPRSAWVVLAAAGQRHAGAVEAALDDPGLRRLHDRFRERTLRAAFVVRVRDGDGSANGDVLSKDPALRRALSVEDADLLAELLTGG